jgi:hypothetical protein
MAILAVALTVSGALISKWFRGYALGPFTIAAWVISALVAHQQAYSLAATIGAALLAGTCFQVGYLIGALLLPIGGASAKQHPPLNR